MGKSKSNKVMEAAAESGSPLAVGLALTHASMAKTADLTEDIINSKNKKIEALEKELAELKDYIYRVQERFTHFFFDAPQYEDKYGHFLF